MRILVLSDTHGDVRDALRAAEFLRPLDMMIHCGDAYRDGTLLAQRLDLPAVCVKGNTDGSYDEREYAIVPTECGDLLVTHGHMEHVDFSQQTLYYKALDLGCVAAIYGHTHRAVNTETGGVTLLNPGSLSRPRDGSGGTFALLVTSPAGLSARIYYKKELDAPQNPGSAGGRSHVKGGYLRRLLNDSDRL